MRLRSLPLLFLPLVLACQARDDAPLGVAEEAQTVCAGPKTLKGVDVSHYDGTIDWAQLKASGRAFAFAKATEGTTYTDPTFATNWAGMAQNGVVRSAYHFFHANMDPIAEADHFLNVMGPLEPGDLPPTLDLEVTDNQSAAVITANTIKWLDHVAAATGMKPILYSSPSFISGTLGSPAGLENHAQLWVANWGVTCPNVPAPFTTWVFWQDSSTGTVPGISGANSVDTDVFNGALSDLMGITKPATTTTSTTTTGSTTGSSGSTSVTTGTGATVTSSASAGATTTGSGTSGAGGAGGGGPVTPLSRGCSCSTASRDGGSEGLALGGLAAALMVARSKRRRSNGPVARKNPSPHS